MTALLTRSPRAPQDKAWTLRQLTQTPFSAPATSAYLLVLVATTAVLSSSSERSDNQLLLSVSTNLHQLAHDPVRVLVASAFWMSGWWELALWTALFAAILAPVERRLGWRRMTMTFAVGHSARHSSSPPAYGSESNSGPAIRRTWSPSTSARATASSRSPRSPPTCSRRVTGTATSRRSSAT